MRKSAFKTLSHDLQAHPAVAGVIVSMVVALAATFACFAFRSPEPGAPQRLSAQTSPSAC
jgi:hypothetical protein